MSVNKVNSDGSLSRVAGGTLYADAPIGEIHAFGGSVIPSGYLLCNGQAVSRTEYSELFAVIGTAYGKGDNSTTFNVPDLREAVPKGTGLNAKGAYHYDNDGIALGEFVDDRIKSHAHNVYVRDTGHVHGVDAASATNWGQSVSTTMCALNVTPATMYPTTSTGSGNAQIQVNSKSNFAGVANSTDMTGGNTTEVKAVGANYIIKAKQVAVPFDMAEYVRNQNVLSGIETVTLPMTAPYDGELIAVASGGGYVTFSINGSQYTVGSLTGLTSTSGLPIKKGDILTLESLVGTAGFTARYYKLRDYTGR